VAVRSKPKVSDWRKSPGKGNWKRPPAPTSKLRIVALQPRNTVSSLFYSYPAALISEWCCVGLQHAYTLKQGRSRPSAGVVKLFTLHARGQLLGPEWKGWTIRGDRLIDPDGGDLTVGRLRAYQLMIQYAAGLAGELGREEQDRFYELLGKVG
jgi:hypothetical protein